MSTLDRTIAVLGAQIAVRESAGSGLPLLMLHGSGASKDAFRKQFESPLASVWRMIAIDLPGHGESSNAADPAAAYSLPALARTVADVIDALGLERPGVLGWSLGGHIAIELLAIHPALAGLMLCGTPPLSRSPIASFQGFHTSWDTLLASKEKYTDRDARRMLELCYRDTADPGFLAGILRADGRLRARFARSVMFGEGIDQKRAVETAPVPVALVNGSDDPIVRLSYVAGIHAPALWEGRSHLVEGGGHTPFWQTPKTFNVLLHRFMHDVSIGRAPEATPAETEPAGVRRAG